MRPCAAFTSGLSAPASAASGGASPTGSGDAGAERGARIPLTTSTEIGVAANPGADAEGGARSRSSQARPADQIESLAFWVLVNANAVRLTAADDGMIWDLRAAGCGWDYIAARIVAARAERRRRGFRNAMQRWGKA